MHLWQSRVSCLDRVCRFTRTARCGWSVAPGGWRSFFLLRGSLSAPVAGVRPVSRLSITSNMKRVASLVRSPLKPAGAVQVRLFQADTHLTVHHPMVPLRRLSLFFVLPGPSNRGSLPAAFSCAGFGARPACSSREQFFFARARVAAVQSRVAAPVVSGPGAPPPTSAFSPFHDGSFWCSKCPRRGFKSAQGLMKHVTHHHAGSIDTCALFVAIERVTCSTPSCGGLRRSGARVRNRCGQATLARLPRWETPTCGPLAGPLLTPARPALRTAPSTSGPRVELPLGGRGFAYSRPTRCSTFSLVVACA